MLTEGQNVISDNIDHEKKTGDKTGLFFICSSRKIIQKQSFILLISRDLECAYCLETIESSPFVFC